MALLCTVLAVCFSLEIQQWLQGERYWEIGTARAGTQEQTVFSRLTPTSSRLYRPLAFAITKHSSIKVTLREKTSRQQSNHDSFSTMHLPFQVLYSCEDKINWKLKCLIFLNMEDMELKFHIFPPTLQRYLVHDSHVLETRNSWPSSHLQCFQLSTIPRPTMFSSHQFFLRNQSNFLVIWIPTNRS